MRMLRWISGNTGKYRIQNEEFRLKVGWLLLMKKEWVGSSQWLKKGRGRPKKTLAEVIEKNM